MVRSIAHEFHWPPEVIGGFFIDGKDYFGLEFWYDSIVEMTKEMDNKK
jgi:hypothetical protein